MKLSWRDIVAGALAILGGVVVFAKLESYSWALIGSWKGALGVIAVIGLLIAALYAIDWVENEASGVFGEVFLWIVAATTVIGSLFATTNKTEFVWSSSLIALAWIAQLGAHTWDTTHHTSHLAHSH